MYSDPTKIRTNVIKLRLSDDELALVDAYAKYSGEQKAVIVRGAILDHIKLIFEQASD